MTFNDTAAAYGLFQVVFADMADHLAVATFRLREHRELGLSFETVFGQQFERTLKQFRQELRQFDDRSHISDRLHDLREACKTMSALAVWRNDRIHARVQMTDHGYVLYDWRTRNRLEITREQIELKINQAIKTTVDLEA